MWYRTIQETHLLNLFQYNASLAITGCFRGISRDKLYSELGLEILADRHFYRRLIAFFKIVNKKTPQYSINYLPAQDSASINLRKRPAIYPLDARTERYHNSLFPFCISQWKILDSRIRNLQSNATFKRVILAPLVCSVYCFISCYIYVVIEKKRCSNICCLVY